MNVRVPHLPNGLDRLLPQWQPGAWVAVVRRASEVCTEFIEVQTAQGKSAGQAVHMHPAQLLLGLWAPQNLTQPLLPRLPQQAWLVTDAPQVAERTLLAAVPEGARLWIAALDVDTALLAEIVLRSEPGLASWQQEALMRLVARERTALSQQIERRFRAGRLIGP